MKQRSVSRGRLFTEREQLTLWNALCGAQKTILRYHKPECGVNVLIEEACEILAQVASRRRGGKR